MDAADEPEAPEGSLPGDRADRVIRVALVNDFPIVVAGLEAFLRPYRERVRVDTATVDGYSIDDSVDVVLYDMFGSSGEIDSLVERTTAKVIVFTSVTDPSAIVAALRTGVSGYVHKGVSSDQLVAAVESVYRSSAPVVRLTSPEEETPTLGRWPGMEHDLSEREAEIMMLVCRGLSNKQIAKQLHLSINSVKTYVRLAYRKVGVQNRAQAVLWGVQRGYVT